MKRIIICVLLMTAMIAAGIYVCKNTGNVTYCLEEELAGLARTYDPASPENTAMRAAEITDIWERFCAENIFLTNNEGAAKISESLIHLTAAAKAGDDDIPEECDALIMLVKAYYASTSVSLKNIF